MSKLTDSRHYGDVSLIEQGRAAGGQRPCARHRPAEPERANILLEWGCQARLVHLKNNTRMLLDAPVHQLQEQRHQYCIHSLSLNQQN